MKIIKSENKIPLMGGKALKAIPSGGITPSSKLLKDEGISKLFERYGVNTDG